MGYPGSQHPIGAVGMRPFGDCRVGTTPRKEDRMTLAADAVAAHDETIHMPDAQPGWEPRRASRRHVLGAAGAGAAGLIAAACGADTSGGPTGGVSTKPVTLLWAVRGGGTPEMREKLLQEYKQLRPNVTV